MGKTRAQIQAEYRKRKKERLGAAFLKAESERQKKYYVPVAQLTNSERKKRRRGVNERVKLHRAREKRATERLREDVVDLPNDLENTDSAISDVSPVPGPSSFPAAPLQVKFQFKKRISTRKRTSRALSRAHKHIEQLTLRLQTAKRENKRIRKRYERASKKIAVTSSSKPVCNRDTPRSKTASELRNAGVSPRSIPKNIKKKLMFTNAVLSEIHEASQQNRKIKEKRTLSRIVAGRVIKRYRLVRYASHSLGLERRSLVHSPCKNIALNLTKTQFRQAWRSLHDEVVNFLSRDDNSRQLPGKKDACKSGNAKSQIRVLNDYIGNLYNKYKSESVGKRHVSLSAFQRIRRSQRHIKLVQFSSRNTSLCQKHQNFALKLKALKKQGLVTNDNPDEFVKCNDEPAVTAMMEKLVNTSEVQFDEWHRVSTDQGKKKTKLQTIVLKGSEFAERFQAECVEFRQHVERVREQYQSINRCKEKLARDECLVHMDFAENYTCIPLEEVQSGYWNQEGVTIHPMVMYYRDESDTLQHQSFVAVSDDKGHNAATILAIIKDLVPRLQNIVPALKRIHYWTDSPTAQYRNKTIFSLVSDHHELFGVFASWNYFEAGHGKGPCDGIGGTVKRLADEAVKRESAVIQDARDFFAWASQEREDSGIIYCFVGKEDCSLAAEEIKDRWSSVKSITGTLKLHAVVGVGNQKLITRDLSCYCENCWVHDELTETTSLMCEGWVTHTLSQPACNAEKPDKTQPVYKPNEWVAAIYDNDWYLGQVIEADDKDIHIKFLKAGSGKVQENVFQFPPQGDKIWSQERKYFATLKYQRSSRRDNLPSLASKPMKLRRSMLSIKTNALKNSTSNSVSNSQIER